MLQYDFTSRITGRPYRLTITPPVHPDTSLLYPALYVLDGSAWFATASEVATVFEATGQTGTGYVITLGYQTDDVMVAADLRNLDLTPFRSPNPQYASETGGGDAFLRVLYEEVQPFLLSHFRVDANRQAIWGHSIGGLMVLRSMLRDPGRFSTYLLASPTINPMVLADEPAFFEKVAQSHLRLRVLITVGGDEPPPPASYLPASNLADTLKAGGQPWLDVEFATLSGEGHLPAAPLSLIRSIQFAWPLAAQSPSPQTSSPLQVDHADYRATCVRGTSDACTYAFRLVAQYHNATPDTLYIDRCTPRDTTPMYGIDYVTDSTQDAAYDRVWACVGHDNPFAVAPHDTRTDTLRIEGPNSFNWKTHTPLGALEGQFRLIYNVGRCWLGRVGCRTPSKPQFSDVFRVHLIRSTGQAFGCHVRGSQQWLATRPSPLDSAVIIVHGATAQICYSRPRARGRLLDSLVPVGRAWRMGANEPTTIGISDSMVVGGAALASGRYVMLAVPGATRWTLTFYTTPDTQPATMFRTMRQVATGSGEVQPRGGFEEQFTIRAEADSAETGFMLEWGTWRIRVPVHQPL